MKALLESGVHFGHQTYKWNPKMESYIFIKRNGIHILDLKQTLDAVNEAYMFIKDISAQGKSVLFVGTKKQAKESIENAAKKSGSFYVSNRWYGGMLTNNKTIRKSVEKLKYYEQIVEDGTISSFTKLEATRMKKEYDRIMKGLGGIRDMEELPGAVFIVDILKERIALNEARILGIPVVAMVDTNCDPDLIDYVIPANDDAIRAINLISDVVANAVIEGKQQYLEGLDIAEEETEETGETKAEETSKTKEEQDKSKDFEDKDKKEKEEKPVSKKTKKTKKTTDDSE
jgi:small subunit ribosomal protein S2